MEQVLATISAPLQLLGNPAGLCPYVNGGGCEFSAGEDVEEEEQVTETEQAPFHIKDSAKTVQCSQHQK